MFNVVLGLFVAEFVTFDAAMLQVFDESFEPARESFASFAEIVNFRLKRIIQIERDIKM